LISGEDGRPKKDDDDNAKDGPERYMQLDTKDDGKNKNYK